jgi:hypothetical protein
MDSHLTQYQTASGEITLHTWTEEAGQKMANYYITGVPGTAVPAWFREVLSRKALCDIAIFPYDPSGETR